MILVPVLIMQIFLFPFAAAMIMDTWTTQSRGMELQELTGHLGSQLLQLYYSINHASISSGSLTLKLETPTHIDGYPYTITMINATNPNLTDSPKILKLTLNLIGADAEASTLITLGENAAWNNNAEYHSNLVGLMNATKISDSIWLTFEDGGV
jgi:hypothetical protein